MPSSMLTLRACLALAVACCALQGAAAESWSRKLLQNCTYTSQNGTTREGYTFGSNVIGYPEYSKDAANIITSSRYAYDFATAKNIFDNGKNAYTRTCTLKTLRSWATSDRSNEPNFQLYQATFPAYGTLFLSTFVDGAFNGVPPADNNAAKVEVIAALSRSTVPLVYMCHELDEAAAKTAAGSTSDASGSPHNIDEGFGIWFGVEGSLGSLSAMVAEAGAAAGTGDAVNKAAAAAFIAAQAAARAGDTTAYNAARSAIHKQALVAHLQMVLHQASRIAKAGAAAQAAAWAHYRSVQPWVKAVSASSDAAIIDAINAGGPADAEAVAKIKAALAPVYADKGVAASEMGVFAAEPSPSPSPSPTPVARPGKLFLASVSTKQQAAVLKIKPIKSATSYLIACKQGAKALPASRVKTSITSTAVTFTFSKLTPNTAFKCSIQAKNAAGLSPVLSVNMKTKKRN